MKYPKIEHLVQSLKAFLLHKFKNVCPDDIEDVIQDTLAKGWKCGKFAQETKLSWFKITARNELINLLKRRKRISLSRDIPERVVNKSTKIPTEIIEHLNKPKNWSYK